MDHWKSDDFSAASAPSTQPLPSSRPHNSNSDSRQRLDVETKDPIVTKKVQKADREKLRRDRLNEHFFELGNTLDPDRPKNDKATILTDTIQMLKDLTADVNKLKAECSALTDESRELTQEKNELREEKASLKSDIENLNVQYQQRLRVMFPWAGMDPSVVMAPPYSYPMPVAVPSGPIPMHPSLQSYPYFQAQNPAAMPNPCSTFVPYPAPANPPVQQPSPQYASVSHLSSASISHLSSASISHLSSASVSHLSSKQDSRSRSSDHQRGSTAKRCDDSNDVATDLELKMPGSSTPQDSSSAVKKAKQSQRKDRSVTDGCPSSRHSTSQVVQDSSSNSVGDVPKPNK